VESRISYRPEDHDTARKSILSSYGRQSEPKDRYWLHVLLFFATLAATMHAGGILVGRALAYEDWGAWWFVPDGLRFAIALLLFLGTHEFGHYFTARFHNVRVSLPYFIPLPFIGIGTLGAVIRIREPVPSLRVLFDIGVAGPLAGFVVALGVLLYAFATLPGPEMVFDLPGHDVLKDYVQQYGTFPDEMPIEDAELVLVVGETLLYWFLSQFFADVPPMYEMYHYPLLFAGWLGLFFTALNLLPVGQLDGGHILYALVGHKWHKRLARGFVILLLASGAIGFVTELAPGLGDLHPSLGELSWFLLAAILFFYLSRVYNGDLGLIAPTLGGIIVVSLLALYALPGLQSVGYTGWFIWCLLIVFMIRIEHPPVLRAEPLTKGRKILGVVSIIIFVLCFSFRPLYIM
jgi:membrane-associated protease RseP (regulator of RpoE activity)